MPETIVGADSAIIKSFYISQLAAESVLNNIFCLVSVHTTFFYRMAESALNNFWGTLSQR
jgi:hypothetical protein